MRQIKIARYGERIFLSLKNEKTLTPDSIYIKFF